VPKGCCPLCDVKLPDAEATQCPNCGARRKAGGSAWTRLDPNKRREQNAAARQSMIEAKGSPGPTTENAIRSGPAQLVCPHCQVKGRVSTKTVNVKKGVSGTKAAGAVVTGGWSVLATGLSRKASVTQMHCANCRTTWHVA
jgi:hypothetical protein